MFIFDSEATPDRTCLRGHVTLPPLWLVEIFGPPIGGDDKCSGEYWFRGDSGVFTIYDWMPEDRYGGCCWSSTEPYRFNVGGTRFAGDFIEWIERRFAGKKVA